MAEKKKGGNLCFTTKTEYKEGRHLHKSLVFLILIIIGLFIQSKQFKKLKQDISMNKNLLYISTFENNMMIFKCHDRITF